jgi:hypothetical protein
MPRARSRAPKVVAIWACSAPMSIEGQRATTTRARRPIGVLPTAIDIP